MISGETVPRGDCPVEGDICFLNIQHVYSVHLETNDTGEVSRFTVLASGVEGGHSTHGIP